MAIDGMILHAVTKALQPLAGGRIGKIQNLSEEEILFHIHTGRGLKRLIINAHSNSNRIYLAQGMQPVQPAPSNFVMFLRKHVSQAIVTSVEQKGFDRILDISLQAQNELGDKQTLHLMCEMMGKYANLVVVDDNGTILDAIKRIPVFENSRRLIHPGARYTLPEQTGKLNPAEITEETQLDENASLVSQISGFSTLLAKETEIRMGKGESLAAILKEILHADSLYYYDPRHFHLIPLQDQPSVQPVPLMEGLENLYREKEREARHKEIFGDLIRTVKNEKKKNERKLPKLEQALEEAKGYEKYRKYGDLLFSNFPEPGKEVQVTDWETGEVLTIPLDPLLDIKKNANRYYAKYQKMKRSLQVLEEQIAACKEDLAYFSQLEEQLKHCSPLDAQEIREELVQGRYLMGKKKPQRKKKSKPNLLKVPLEDGTIYVGKNNLQNSYLTHKLASRSDLWFHVQGYHGSHVILQSEQPTEEQIRAAAMLAAWHSKGQHSSSVPVDYTPVHQLKKVPGSKAGFVTMKSHKTIYIDPEETQVQQLLKKVSR